MRCPNCGSENCHYVTATTTHSKGFSSGDACCGMILIGPIGLLCGFCGTEEETKIKEYWICYSCGTKFSQFQAQKMMKEEAKRVKEFLFYREVQQNMIEDSYSTPLGDRIIKGRELYLKNVFPQEKILISNPILQNEKFEALKYGMQGVLNEKELVYLVMPNEGIVLADKGLILKHRLYGWPSEFRRYKQFVYIGQSFIETESESEAEELCKFLKYVYLKDDEPIVEVYNSYSALIPVLQNLQAEDFHSYSHFSSQPEYASLISDLKEKAFFMFKKTDPEAYQKFQEISEGDDEENYRWIRYLFWALGIGMILFLAKWFFLGEFTMGVIAGLIVIIPVIIWVLMIFYKNEVDSNECLPDYVKNVIDEDKKTNLEKTGNINVLIFTDIL